jgi:SAM-dependent methyltransferase
MHTVQDDLEVHPTAPVRVAVMNPNKALWQKGDFTRIAECMRHSGERLVQRAGITPGMRVLDLGCGDGTTALPAAELGANVLGVDIARNLVAAGNRRAAQAGLQATCHFVEGDAADLGSIESRSVDLVISMFGAMFSPKPFDVAREMVRVTKPGGRIIMGNWIPSDPTLVAQILKISAAYSPAPPEGFISPMTWGVPSQVTERFGAAGIAWEGITCERESYEFEFNGTAAQFVDLFREYYGPTMNAFEAAAKDGKADALRSELVALFERQNQSPRAGATRIAATFLKVTVDVG